MCVRMQCVDLFLHAQLYEVPSPCRTFWSETEAQIVTEKHVEVVRIAVSLLHQLITLFIFGGEENLCTLLTSSKPGT